MSIDNQFMVIYTLFIFNYFSHVKLDGSIQNCIKTTPIHGNVPWRKYINFAIV